MAKVNTTVSLSESHRNTLDSWSDSNDLNRSSAVEQMIEIVAESDDISDDAGDPLADIPETLDITEARVMFSDATEGSDKRTAILAAALRGEFDGLVAAADVLESVRDVTGCAPHYAPTWGDRLERDEHIVKNPIMTREWLTGADVQRIVKGAIDEHRSEARGYKLWGDIETREDVRSYLGIPDHYFGEIAIASADDDVEDLKQQMVSATRSMVRSKIDTGDVPLNIVTVRAAQQLDEIADDLGIEENNSEFYAEQQQKRQENPLFGGL